MTCVIPDYGCGNLASVARMVNRIGFECGVSRSPEDLARADAVILAGVGAFDAGMSHLQQGGWIAPLNQARERGVPILGICLGMQIMAKCSEEGSLPGLDWLNARVLRFKFNGENAPKVPHMGWNTVSVTRPNALIPADLGEQRFYFVHSYHVVCDSPCDVVATVHHGGDVVAGTQRENVYGVQFHPEKSHRFGMQVLKRFLELHRC